jgi:hypothetical protein
MSASSNPYLGQDNPYLTSLVDKAQGDLVRNWNTVAQPAFNSAMVNSGSFGNAGLQQLNENGQRNLQDALGNVSTQLRGQDYTNQQSMYQWDQAFDKNIYDTTFSQNQQQLQSALGLLGTANGYSGQDLTNANTIQNTPLTYWQQFANQSNQFGNAGGATNAGTTASGGSPLMGALGGAQLGSAFANYGNNSYGNSVYNPATNSGGWGNSNSGLGSFFYGNGTSGG